MCACVCVCVISNQIDVCVQWQLQLITVGSSGFPTCDFCSLSDVLLSGSPLVSLQAHLSHLSHSVCLLSWPQRNHAAVVTDAVALHVQLSSPWFAAVVTSSWKVLELNKYELKWWSDLFWLEGRWISFPCCLSLMYMNNYDYGIMTNNSVRID